MEHRHLVTPARCPSPATTERAPSAYRVTGKARSSGPRMAATTPPPRRRHPPSFRTRRWEPSAGHHGAPPDAASTLAREHGTMPHFGPLDRRCRTAEPDGTVPRDDRGPEMARSRSVVESGDSGHRFHQVPEGADGGGTGSPRPRAATTASTASVN